jgi:hypothetical protein
VFAALEIDIDIKEYLKSMQVKQGKASLQHYITTHQHTQER